MGEGNFVCVDCTIAYQESALMASIDAPEWVRYFSTGRSMRLFVILYIMITLFVHFWNLVSPIPDHEASK